MPKRRERIQNPWRPYPEAPDVSDHLTLVRKVLAGETLTAAFGGGIDAEPAVGLYRNLIRLTIRACEEFREAVDCLDAAVEHRDVMQPLLASSHWEGCIEALHRAMRIADVFRTHLGKWVPDDSDFRVDKSARFTEDDWDPIRRLRNAVQHLDTGFGEWADLPPNERSDTAIFIVSTQDGITFQGISISFKHLAALLARLASLCQWLHMQEIPAGHPLAQPGRTSALKITDAEPFGGPFLG